MKTTYIKKIARLLFFILHFSFFIPLNAQNDTSRAEKLYREYAREFNYKYIFQGKIISSKYGVSEKTGEYTYANFNSYLVEIDKVLKGNIQKGTVEILEPIDGVVYKKGEHVISGLNTTAFRQPPKEGIYFSNSANNVIDSTVRYTNSKSFICYDAIVLHNGELKGANLPTLAEFYAYLSANYGIK